VSVQTQVLDIRAGGETVDAFRDLGFVAFTTGRAGGSFGTQSDEPVRQVMARWSALRALAGGDEGRLATAIQVHGNGVLVHEPCWQGWLRGGKADGHIAPERGTALAVTVADCVPVFIAHPSGVVSVLHSGWRGTVARITEQALSLLGELGLPAAELRLHCGPAICGSCYEVSPDVYGQLTGRAVDRPTVVDLRSVIAGHARAAGVRDISVSALCTRCNNDRFYSHRAGDAGRQLAVAFAPGG
jgi:polyphenol oxidase